MNSELETLVVYDLDDTLFPNHQYYVAAKRKFIQIVLGSNTTNQQVKELSDLTEKINRANIPLYGYSTERFGLSLREAYETWQTKHKLQTDGEIASSAYKLGIGVANENEIFRTGLYEGTLEMFDLHQSRNDRLVLLTKGLEATQRMKIETLGLARYFEQIIIVPTSKEAAFSSFASYAGSKWTIGNSVKSDIIPALKYGFRGIHMDTDTWEFEKAPTPVGVATVQNMRQLREYISALPRQIKAA